jgi:hypothetical protein
MELTIESGNGRQTGNQAWTPPGPEQETMSRKLFDAGLNAKVIAQRLVDHPAATKELLQMGNDLMSLAKGIDEKEKSHARS